MPVDPKTLKAKVLADAGAKVLWDDGWDNRLAEYCNAVKGTVIAYHVRTKQWFLLSGAATILARLYNTAADSSSKGDAARIFCEYLNAEGSIDPDPNADCAGVLDRLVSEGLIAQAQLNALRAQAQYDRPYTLAEQWFGANAVVSIADILAARKV